MRSSLSIGRPFCVSCTTSVSRLKKTPYAPRRDHPEEISERHRFRRKQRHFPAAKMVFIDESGCHPGIGPRRGWAPRGQPLHGPEQIYARGRHVSMIAALTWDGISALMTVRGGVRSRHFERFVYQRLLPTLNPGDVVAWDNLNLHKRPDFRIAIESVGASVVQLPRYSPDLNPIEPTWAKLKNWIRKKCPQTVNELRDLMRRGLRRIRACDAQGWFRYCGYSHQCL